MTEGTSSLSIQNLKKSYGDHVAIESVNLDVRSGELVTLLGPSGSGKTTLLMCVAGFAQPDAGRITLNGQDITALRPHRRGIGMVFQQYALFPHLNVADNIAYPLAIRHVPKGERRSAVAAALRLVRLEGYDERRPHQLSGGQQQRVALARALVFKPPVLLMDEPLSALDRKLRAEMQIEIRNIQKTLGVTTIYVTHDQEEALAISDRIAIMHGGRIEQISCPEDVYQSPTSAFVANFIGDSNLFAGRVERSIDGTSRFVADCGIVFAIVRSGQGDGHDAGTALVRPENVQVAPFANAACPYQGIVQQCVYGGSTLRLRIAIKGGAAISASVNPSFLPSTPGVNQDIWFGWRPEDAFLVPSS